MFKTLNFYLMFLIVVGIAVSTANAQPPVSGEINPPPFPSRGTSQNDDRPKSIREQLSKSRIERERKEHEELLGRGEEALILSERLEYSLEKNNKFTAKDLRDLQALEKVVSRIRRDLGGDSDKQSMVELEKEVGSNSGVKDAFKFLRTSTVNLVSELKKSSRFTVSAAAIQSSNMIISVARFLRLKK